MLKDKTKLIAVCERLKEICREDKCEYKESKKELVKLFHWLESYEYEDKNEIESVIEVHRNLSLIKKDESHKNLIPFQPQR